MNNFKVGDKSKGLCPDCGITSTTFILRDLSIKGHDVLVKNVLMGACDDCGNCLTVPHQETEHIKLSIGDKNGPT